MSNSVRPHRRQPTRLPHPSPGKNTGVDCHFLFQCMKVKSESEVAQSCPTLCDAMDYSLLGSSVHGILQARTLEWVAISFSRESPWPRDRTQVSRIAGRRFNLWATREAWSWKFKTISTISLNKLEKPLDSTGSIYTWERHISISNSGFTSGVILNKRKAWQMLVRLGTQFLKD